MPGMLTNLFGDDGGTSGSTESHELTAGGEIIDISPEITIEMEMGGTYQNLDGSTTTWSSDQSITLTADVNATLTAVTSLDASQLDQG